MDTYFIDYAYTKQTLVALNTDDPAPIDPPNILEWARTVKDARLIFDKNLFHHDLDDSRWRELMAIAEVNHLEVLGISLNAPKTALWRRAVMNEDHGRSRAELERQSLKYWLPKDFDAKTKVAREQLADDANAVEAIRAAVIRGAHLKPLRWTTLPETELDKFHRIRTSGQLTGAHPWVQEITRGVPLYADFFAADPNAAVYYGDPEPPKRVPKDRLKGWSLEPLVVTLLAINESSSRNEFDFKMGMFDHALRKKHDAKSSGTFRSAMVYRASVVWKRYMRAAGLNAKDAPFFEPSEHQILKKQALREARRATRVLYHTMKRGTTQP